MRSASKIALSSSYFFLCSAGRSSYLIGSSAILDADVDVDCLESPTRRENVLLPKPTGEQWLSNTKSREAAKTAGGPWSLDVVPQCSGTRPGGCKGVPPDLYLGYDLSSLLTFDPEFIEPAASKASEASGPSATHGQLQHLKAMLSSSIETLVEDTEEVKSVLEDIQPHLPVTLQRIGLRHAQLPLKADIADKCGGLMRKKQLWTQTTTPPQAPLNLEILRKELEDLEERVRVTKQLIQDKEALIARSHEEAEGLKAELKTDLAEIRALNKQLVTGQDEDDEAEIAEVDRVRCYRTLVPLRHSFRRAPSM
ncbi:hypothetical protein QYE76_034059 [Lolium multiflorum]|uniref:Uncharacterized protein n=1 Tax=Lolium multiflorum TaxID=4521 RepID=A0AAD8VM36_LOLMU|nr:hypothetical protein QYE76_034059 [Lolium multiflorum]